MDVFLNEEPSSEAKKDLWHSYLRESGISVKLNEILNKLLQSNLKPDNPLDFIREELGDKPISPETFDSMELELDDAQREIRRLRGIIKELGIENMDEQFGGSEAEGTDEFENMANEFNNSMQIVTCSGEEEQQAVVQHQQ